MKRIFIPSALVLVLGCAVAPIAKACTSPLDSPRHHSLQAMKYLADSNTQNADRAIHRAIECDKKYAPAYAAEALLYALRATDSKEAHDSKRALKALSKAKRFSKTNEYRFVYHLSAIRVLGLLYGVDKQRRIEKHLRKAKALKLDNGQLLYYERPEAAHYFVGLNCFRGGKDLGCARDHMRKVLDAGENGPWHAQADLHWKKADRAVRALSGVTVSQSARAIVLQDSISRADVAAFLIDELQINKILSGRLPTESKVEPRAVDFTPADIMQHPFKQEILTLLKWQVRGLEPDYDTTTQAYLFSPDKSLKRKEFAFIAEGLLTKLTGDKKLSRRFVGEKSPYPDVQAQSAWFNATMVAVTRGLMETSLSGKFRPEDDLSGVEFLLSIRKLKYEFGI